MWSKGIIEIAGIKIQYWVKRFEEGSDFGINNGKISKLECRINNKTIINYDRGWDRKPKTKLSRQAYDILVKRYN